MSKNPPVPTAPLLPSQQTIEPGSPCDGAITLRKARSQSMLPNRSTFPTGTYLL